MREPAIAVLLALALAGCQAGTEQAAMPSAAPEDDVSAGGSASQAPGAPDAAHANATVGPVPVLPMMLDRCALATAEFHADPADFEGGLPSGFRLAKDGLGQARILAFLASCGSVANATSSGLQQMILAAVAVVPPPELTLGDRHGILLSSWVDGAELAGFLEQAMLVGIEVRTIAVERDEGPVAGLRARVEPDFLLTAHGVALAPQQGGGLARLFSMEEGRVVSALDVLHAADEGVAGPATASFIVQPTGSDLPAHYVGTAFAASEGSVMLVAPTWLALA